jgi:hypothetical protein
VEHRAPPTSPPPPRPGPSAAGPEPPFAANPRCCNGSMTTERRYLGEVVIAFH